MSDGTSVDGKVSLTRGKRLLVRLKNQAKPVTFALSELAQLKVIVLKTRIEKEWRFTEEGSAEKMYTGRTRARLDFGIKLTLLDGTVVNGVLPKGTPIFVDYSSSKKRRRLFLPQSIDGEFGKAGEEIIYLREITFGPLMPVIEAPK